MTITLDFGPIAPDTLAAIRDARLPRQIIDPDDDPRIQCSRGWWQAMNHAHVEANVPPRYAGATTDRAEIHAWVLTAVADPAQAGSLLLAGPTGTGKTHAAYAALRLASEALRPVKWTAASTATLFGDLRPAPGRNTEGAMAGYRDAPLLFLDDLGAEKRTEWTEEVLYRIVDHRWAHCLPSIFATNHLPGELGTHIGARTASRLMGMCRVIAIKGDDRRKDMR